jgi:hypothetical protein
MVIEGFRGSSGGGSIGGGGGGGHESQFSSLGGRLTPTGFQHQGQPSGQPSSHFDRYNWEQNRDRDRDRDSDRNNNNNVIHVGGGGGGYDRNHYRNDWNGYYPPYTYYNPLVYQDRQPTEIVINEDKNKPKDKMDETVKILLIVFICLFVLVMLFMMLNFFKK